MPIKITIMNKDLNYYMNLKYAIETRPEQEGWSACMPELDGLIGAGDTPAEALEMLEDAKEGWFIRCLQHVDRIPEPQMSLVS